jgi:hypothetical protein
MKFPKIILLLISLLIMINSVRGVGIGVSPGAITFNGVLRGGYAEDYMTISTDSKEGIIASLKVTGYIKDWVRFGGNVTRFNISSSKPYRLKVIVDPPENIGNGSYSGEIEFVTERVAGNITGRAGGFIKAGVKIFLTLEIIGEEKRACKAGGFHIKDVEKGYPLELEYTLINEGNVRIRPVLSIDLWDQLQENLMFSKEIFGVEVLPTVKEKVIKKLQNRLDIGQYWARVTVSECEATNLITFSVLEKGSIVDKGELREVRTKVWAYVNETVEIKALFQNQGERTVTAKFKGSIKLDNHIVKIIETEEVDVPSLKETEFIVYFKPEKPGRYTIDGRVLYNKKLTFEKGSILNVNYPPAEVAEGESTIIPLLLYVVIIISILFLIRVIMKEKKRRRIF